MKLKLNEQGFAVVRDGKPVYTHSDGREEAFDAPSTVTALNRRLFETSKFVGEKLSIPADVALARFSGSFKAENGNVVAYDKHGLKMYSRSRPGEVANFDEAIEQLVDQYPNKDMIIRKDVGKGSGAPTAQANSGSSGTGNKNVITRTQFDRMPPLQRAAHFKNGGSVVD